MLINEVERLILENVNYASELIIYPFRDDCVTEIAIRVAQRLGTRVVKDESKIKQSQYVVGIATIHCKPNALWTEIVENGSPRFSRLNIDTNQVYLGEPDQVYLGELLARSQVHHDGAVVDTI